MRSKGVNRAWGIRAWLFPSLLGLSALTHLVLVRNFLVHSSPQKIEFSSGETTEVFLIEETPPVPEPIPEPAPTPEPLPEEPPPPKAEEILTTNQSTEMAPAQPTPEPRKVEKKPTPPRPAPVAAAKTANVPQPVVIRNTPPVYPETARRAGWEGRVTVRVEVSADGSPLSVTLQKSSGYGLLDQAALRAVKSWKFQPRTMGGITTAGTVDVPVNFTLSR
ncbi:MAG: energy transducer TonB [Spartobacteria bacterium]